MALRVLFQPLAERSRCPRGATPGELRGVKVKCPWCEREGRPADLGEREPLDDPAVTHGICRRHALGFFRTLPSHSFPGVQLLLVVNPKESTLFEFLQRRLAGVSGVKVIVDRRRGERRRAPQSAPDERRRVERRVREGDVYALGYTVIRFGGVAPR